ncbi:MAG: 5-formyltetrahydrofolate cyclo-ligase [Hydrococcus sp. SU_1_0]|nr:5-formyltetrahydrofolate cyclo-ligase [Hydrococcus sp. SU_1_0]
MSKLDKSALRRQILHQRQSLSPAEWQAKSNQICDRLKSLLLFQEAQTVFAYFSFRQEPDLSSLFSLGKTWAFPRCIGKSLVWHSWQPGTELNTGKYGISEPLDTAPTIEPATTDLILVPTVACDVQGYRLGYGGGFYDRLLSRDRTLNHTLNIPTIGIVFDFAYGIQLPTDPWDMKLSFSCTETKFASY